jgi:hypothetical protein
VPMVPRRLGFRRARTKCTLHRHIKSSRHRNRHRFIPRHLQQLRLSQSPQQPKWPLLNLSCTPRRKQAPCQSQLQRIRLLSITLKCRLSSLRPRRFRRQQLQASCKRHQNPPNNPARLTSIRYFGKMMAVTDPEKLRAVQVASDNVTPKTHVPRERKPAAPVSNEPLVQVETQR